MARARRTRGGWRRGGFPGTATVREEHLVLLSGLAALREHALIGEEDRACFLERCEEDDSVRNAPDRWALLLGKRWRRWIENERWRWRGSCNVTSLSNVTSFLLSKHFIRVEFLCVSWFRFFFVCVCIHVALGRSVAVFVIHLSLAANGH